MDSRHTATRQPGWLNDDRLRTSQTSQGRRGPEGWRTPSSLSLVTSSRRQVLARTRGPSSAGDGARPRASNRRLAAAREFPRPGRRFGMGVPPEHDLMLYCQGRFDVGEVAVVADPTMTVGELRERAKLAGVFGTSPAGTWKPIHIRVAGYLKDEASLHAADIRYGDFIYWHRSPGIA
jgi:hypothetical protein